MPHAFFQFKFIMSKFNILEIFIFNKVLYKIERNLYITNGSEISTSFIYNILVCFRCLKVKALCRLSEIKAS